jgi:hypothetical protein
MKRFSMASLVVVLLALTAIGCSKDGPVSPNTSQLQGTWLLMTKDGQDFSHLAGYYTISSDRVTIGSAVANCITVSSYKVEGNKIITTVITDACGEDPAGTKDTVTYTINGNQLTITSDDGVYVAERGTPSPVAGLWLTESVDGQPVPEGIDQMLQFGHKTFGITKYENGEETCAAVLNYTVSGNKLPMTTVQSGCEGLEVGSTDQPTYSIAGNKLTLKFVDNTTLVAVRQ